MFKKFIPIHHEHGFTLAETLVALAVSGLIISGIIAIFIQTITATAANNNRMEAVKQVENAMHWIDRDSQQASRNSIALSPPALPDFLILSWTTFSGDRHDVTYSLNSSILTRSESINSGTPSVTTIANHIVSGSSNYTFNGKILAVNLTCTITGFKPVTESRTLYVLPRVSD